EYDCNLESSALAQAKTCSSSGVSGEGQNVHSGVLVNNSEQAVRTAMDQWWNQITIRGVNAAMLFRARVRDKPDGPVAFTQVGLN
ncbi:hypothetical protein NECAME_18011, partial [Necator americanus]